MPTLSRKNKTCATRVGHDPCEITSESVGAHPIGQPGLLNHLSNPIQINVQ